MLAELAEAGVQAAIRAVSMLWRKQGGQGSLCPASRVVGIF